MAEPRDPLIVQELECFECGRAWLVPTERWRVLLTDDDDPPVPVPYCPDCAEREFG